MTLGPAHALAALLLEDADLRAARLAVDHAEHLDVGHERGAGKHFTAVFFEEQDAIDADFVASLRVDTVDLDHRARGHLDLAAATLNDCKHLYRLLDGGGKTLGYQNDHTESTCGHAALFFRGTACPDPRYDA